MNRIKTIMALSAIAVIAAGAILAWRLHFWSAAGTAVHVTTLMCDGQEFQIWQVKNPDMFEPYATGVFLRSNDIWEVICLDFEDTFKPSITIRKDGSVIVIRSDGIAKLTFDPSSGKFRRVSDGALMMPAVVRIPPGNWWQQPKT